MVAAALLAFLTPVYRRVSASYAEAGAEATATADAASSSPD
jgi:DHA3 family multidrug efflux protein-like MFS transporter